MSVDNPMAETQSAPSLREMSEAASQGEWSLGETKGGYRYLDATGLRSKPGPDRNTPWSGFARFVIEMEDGLSCAGPSNAALAVALVNAFRSGRLIDPTTLTEAIASARAEGVREGLERAADEVSHRARSLRVAGIPCDTNTTLANSADRLATAIRALIPAPPTTPGGRTDG